MIKIGVISDTHGQFSVRTQRFLEPVDELWHAGDIGSLELANMLEQFKPLRAVCGNIDGQPLQWMYSSMLRFRCEEADILMIHIGGYPEHYMPDVRRELRRQPPTVLVCGHSHILRVMFDPQYRCLYINPGAAGNQGFHKVCTAVRFNIDGAAITNMEVHEFARKDF
ncbi:MAG: metallophosphatase family protein [Bacteroidales bacterium]|jgi:putative phosphoesterase|nr:metallophosphatase family protein [Bacteroidales bacterium]